MESQRGDCYQVHMATTVSPLAVVKLLGIFPPFFGPNTWHMIPVRALHDVLCLQPQKCESWRRDTGREPGDRLWTTLPMIK